MALSGVQTKEFLEGGPEGKTHYLMPQINDGRRGFMSRGPSYEVLSQVFPDLEWDQLNPVGFDLRVGKRIVKGDFLDLDLKPRDFEKMNALPFPLEQDQPKILEADENGRIVYYVESLERFDLPHTYDLLIDAKSTTGRVGCMCHHVGKSLMGNQIVAVQPFAFPIKIRAGKTRLFQAFLRHTGSEYMGNGEI